MISKLPTGNTTTTTTLRVLSFTPVQGDIAAANVGEPEENTPFGYNKKNIEVTGNWYFAKKRPLKVGYEGEIMDRSNRDVEHATENGFVTAIDTLRARTSPSAPPITIRLVILSITWMSNIGDRGGSPLIDFQPAL